MQTQFRDGYRRHGTSRVIASLEIRTTAGLKSRVGQDGICHQEMWFSSANRRSVRCSCNAAGRERASPTHTAGKFSEWRFCGSRELLNSSIVCVSKASCMLVHMRSAGSERKIKRQRTSQQLLYGQNRLLLFTEERSDFCDLEDLYPLVECLSFLHCIL